MLVLVCGGNSALALASSVASLCISALMMPAMFGVSVAVINALSDDGASRITLKLPLMEIFTGICTLLATAGVGVAIKARVTDATVATANKWGIRICYVAFVGAVTGAAASPDLISGAVYTGAGAGRFWCAIALMHVISCGVAALCGLPFADATVRDAVILTSIRRNPLITAGVAALTFYGSDELDFSVAFGMSLACCLCMDWFSLPLICVIRYRRFGQILPKKEKPAEGDGDDAGAEGEDLELGAATGAAVEGGGQGADASAVVLTAGRAVDS